MKRLTILLTALIFSYSTLACVEMNSLKYCKGALVVNKSGLKAQIMELLPNNRAVVKYHQYEIEEYANLKDLAVTNGTSMGYQLNEKVMTPYGEEGVISGFFQDKSVSIFVDDFWNNKVFHASKIAALEGCIEEQFCVGDIVKNSYNKEGEIIAIFPFEGKVFLSFPTQERLFKWSTEDLIPKS